MNSEQSTEDIPDGRILGLPPHIQFEILVLTPPEDFSNVCRANREICSGRLSDATKLTYGDQITERLYKERSEKWFSEEVLAYKELNMTWQNFYKRIEMMSKLDIKYIDQFEKLIEKNQLMELKILQSRNKLPTFYISLQNLANAAIWFKHDNILNWFASLDPPVYPNFQGANDAAALGRVDILKWLSSLNHPVYADRYGAVRAAYNGHLDVLKFLSTQTPPVYPDAHAVSSARGNGHTNIVEWLASVPPPYGPILAPRY